MKRVSSYFSSCVVGSIIFLGVIANAATTPTIQLISPTFGSSANSPVFYKAVAFSQRCPGGVTAMKVITAPGVVAYNGIGSQLQTFIPLAPGNYKTVIEAIDHCGGKSTISVAVNVSSQGGVTVYSPIAGLAPTPVTVSASASSPSCRGGITSLVVNAGTVDAYKVNSDHLNAVLYLPAGTYKFTVEAQDNCGGAFNRIVNARVSNPQDKFVYSSTSDVAFISGFQIGSAGTLTPIGQFGTQLSAPLNIVKDPTGRFLYAITLDQGIVAFRIDPATGNLTLLPGSPFPAGNKDATGIGIDSLGNFLFVSDAFNHVTSFRIDSQTGVPRPAVTVPTPLQALAGNIVTDASGQYVYVIQSPNATAAYKLDFATGNLTPIAGSPFPAGPNGNYSTTNHFLYTRVSSASQQYVAGFVIDTNTGALTQVPGSPFSIPNIDIAIDPVNNLLYAGSSIISSWKIDNATGSLSALAQSTEPDYSPIGSMIVDQSGTLIYGITESSTCQFECESSIASFSVDLATGDVTENSGPFPVSSFGVNASFAEKR